MTGTQIFVYMYAICLLTPKSELCWLLFLLTLATISSWSHIPTLLRYLFPRYLCPVRIVSPLHITPKLLDAHRVSLRVRSPNSYLDLILSLTILAIRKVGVRTKRCLKNWIARDEPTNREISNSLWIVNVVIRRLYTCRLQLARQLSHHTDAIYAIQLIDEVVQAFRDDHDGSVLSDMLSLRRETRAYLSDQKIFATFSKKMAMIRIWERWNDSSRFEKQFWALSHLWYYLSLSLSRGWTSLANKQCLIDWLQKRKIEQVY